MKIDTRATKKKRTYPRPLKHRMYKIHAFIAMESNERNPTAPNNQATKTEESTRMNKGIHVNTIEWNSMEIIVSHSIECGLNTLYFFFLFCFSFSFSLAFSSLNVYPVSEWSWKIYDWIFFVRSIQFDFVSSGGVLLVVIHFIVVRSVVRCYFIWAAKCQSSETWSNFPLNSKQSTQMLHIFKIEKVFGFCSTFPLVLQFAGGASITKKRVLCWISNSHCVMYNFQMFILVNEKCTTSNTQYTGLIMQNNRNPFFKFSIITFFSTSFLFLFISISIWMLNVSKVGENTPKTKTLGNCSFQQEIV